MSEKQDLPQQKKEAAAKAKATALARKHVKEEAAEKPEGELDLMKQKAAAAAKAKAVALARKKAKEEAAEKPEGELDLAKQKAAAAAKAKAAALARKKAKEEASEKPEGELDLAKQKAAAAAKAKAAALARKQAKEGASEKPEGELDLAKQKAAAAAKAKAAALAQKQAKEEASEKPEGELGLAKQKAAAAANAKAAALARKQAKEEASEKPEGELDLVKQKAAAAAKAKAAAVAKARNIVKESKEDHIPDEPSPNQAKLDQIVHAIERNVGQEALIDHYINRLSKDVPTIVANPDTYFLIAKFLRYDEQLNFSYLSELHGTDFETYMEIYVHLHSFNMNQSVALKVRLDRDSPAIPSLVPLWSGANWPECEAYDLLGINFQEHPDLKRILLGDDWKGYPLRKDYQPYDVEV